MLNNNVIIKEELRHDVSRHILKNPTVTWTTDVAFPHCLFLNPTM